MVTSGVHGDDGGALRSLKNTIYSPLGHAIQPSDVAILDATDAAAAAAYDHWSVCQMEVQALFRRWRKLSVARFLTLFSITCCRSLAFAWLKISTARIPESESLFAAQQCCTVYQVLRSPTGPGYATGT